MSAVELVGEKIWFAHLKSLEMRMRKLVLDLSVAQNTSRENQQNVFTTKAWIYWFVVNCKIKLDYSIHFWKWNIEKYLLYSMHWKSEENNINCRRIIALSTLFNLFYNKKLSGFFICSVIAIYQNTILNVMMSTANTIFAKVFALWAIFRYSSGSRSLSLTACDFKDPFLDWNIFELESRANCFFLDLETKWAK